MELKKDKKFLIYWGINILLILFIIVAFARNFPVYYENYKMQGSIAYLIKVKDKNGNEGTLPYTGRKQVFVFWATYCGPCKFEIDRLVKAADAGDIKTEDINLISVMEDPKLVSETVESRGYKFNSFTDETGDASAPYNIRVTPTIYLIDQVGKIEWVSSGISPTLISRVTRFLKE